MNLEGRVGDGESAAASVWGSDEETLVSHDIGDEYGSSDDGELVTASVLGMYSEEGSAANDCRGYSSNGTNY